MKNHLMVYRPIDPNDRNSEKIFHIHNNLVRILGLVKEAIRTSSQTSVNFRDALFNLDSEAKKHGYCQIYEEGLAELRTVNPDFKLKGACPPLDLAALKKKLDEHRAAHGNLGDMPPDLLSELRRAWKNFLGSESEFRIALGTKHNDKLTRRILVGPLSFERP